MIYTLLQKSPISTKTRYWYLLFAIIGFANIGHSQCTYTLQLFDSFGDGWNGSILTVDISGTTTDYTINNGDEAIFEINPPPNELVIISYTIGGFQNEVTYEILDPSGDIIFSDGPFPQDGEVFSFFACPTCPGPSAISVDHVGGIDADISWSPSDSSGTYTVEYGPAGFMPGTGTSLTTMTTSTTLTGLSEDTAYDFYVSISCDNGDMSATIGPTSFQTIWLIDVGITAIFSPKASCELSSETVEVTLRNFGDNPQSLIPFKFAVNDMDAGVSQPSDGFYTGVLSQDSSVTLTFETTFDFSEAGNYEIIAWTELANDADLSNDSTNFMTVSIPVVSDFPYLMDFETWTGGWLVDQELSENSSWAFGVPQGNDIPAAASGINAIVTNLSGNYNNNELSYLVSPCLDFSDLNADPVINFSINYDTENNWDGAWLEASTDDGLNWSKVGTMNTGVNWYNFNNINENLGNVWAGNSGGWINAENNLSGLAGESTVRLRFVFDTDGSGNNFDGIGLDDIFISPVFSDDLSALSVTNTSTLECGDEMDQVTIEIRNAGSDGQTGFNVSYQVNGGTPVTENVGGLVLNSGVIETYTFATPFNSNILNEDFEIIAWTDLDNELNVLNDTAAYVFSTVIPTYLPIAEDFEAGVLSEGWTASDAGIGMDHNNASVVVYDNLYGGDQNYELTSPILGPINAGDSLTYDYRYTIWSAGTTPQELGPGDMLELQISSDCGQTFNTVQTINMDNHVPTAVMTNVLFDLDAYAGQYIKIRLVATWGTGDYWIDLDNINIIGCPADFGLDIFTAFESSAGAEDGAITIDPTQGTAPYTIMWDDPNAPDDISAGTYTVSISDALGCEEVLDIEVGVCPGDLGLDANITGVSVAGAMDGSVLINTGDGEGPYSFEWSTGQTTAFVSNLGEGEYTITVSDANACSDEITITVGTFVNTYELNPTFADVLLAPNPTSGLTELSLELNQSAEVFVQVLNIVGKVIYEAPREQLIRKTYQLDLSEEPGGMYFVRVFADNQSKIVKLIKAQ